MNNLYNECDLFIVKLFMKFFQKILLLFIIVWGLFIWVLDTYASSNFWDGETYFIVTAYYSPLPNQKKYLKGNYAADIRLNGKGIAWASGTGVFPGMLAAPKSYEFWTDIFLEWVWIGTVEDRGGAIVNAGKRGYEYDRIDIWMWYGDEWLERALKWGKRKIKGKVLSWNYDANIAFDNSPVTQYENLYVTPESKRENVKKLQELFSQLNLYSDKIDGSYFRVKDELINYQLDAGIISSKSDDGAWYFGPKTIASLKSKYGWGMLIVDESINLLSQYSLTRRESIQVETIKKKIDKYLDKKYKGSELKKQRYKRKLKTKIEKYIASTKSFKKKSQLVYLKNII